LEYTGRGDKMPQFLTQLYQQIKGIWDGLSRGQKAVIFGALAVVIASLIALVAFTAREEYVVLYTDIDAEEAGRIASKLEEWRQPYKLDGTTIKVPIADRDRLRLKLAEEELAPVGGVVTFEIFDKLRLTATDYERRINFLRALQGELTRTIKSIQQIDDVRVHIVLPEKKLYTEEEKPATASINLKIKPYAKLEPAQVKGIIYLVASAVEGLDPANVIVTDNKGNILSEFVLEEEDDQKALAASQLEIQNTEARKIERKIRQRLGRVLGPDKVEVMVRCEINFDRLEEHSEQYSMPGFEQLKVSEELEKEQFEGVGVRPVGPPGVDANVPRYKGLEEVEGPVKYLKDEKRINYLADKRNLIRVRSPKITKISVAVFIDGTYERDPEGRLVRDEEGNPIYIPRTQAEMKKYEDLVWAAIGAEKGKKYPECEYVVEVKNIQFDRTLEWEWERREREAAAQRRLMGFLALGALALLIGAVALFRWMAWRRRLREEELARRRELEREAALRAAEAKRLEIPLAPEDRERIELEERTAQIAREKPEQVADLIRTWLAEEE
jgi:flagellar M-ring protein FliF